MLFIKYDKNQCCLNRFESCLYTIQNQYCLYENQCCKCGYRSCLYNMIKNELEFGMTK